MTAASTVTFGRASYTIPITPNGTVICFRSIPFGKVEWRNVIPSGSGNLLTWRAPLAIPSTRVGVSNNRSSSEELIFAARARTISSSLAAIISALLAIIASAIAFRAALRSAPVATFKVRAAALAVSARLLTMCVAIMTQSLSGGRPHMH